MAKINFYKVGNEEKSAVFTEIARVKGMKPFAVEKDWWVSRTLEIIFQMEIGNHLVFKGGTSLSKAWKLINRFSEDIDLAIDREFLGYSGNLSKNQREKLRKDSGAYTTNVFFDELRKAFIEKGFLDLEFIVVESHESDKDPRVLEIYYPNVIAADTEYLLPKVQIEVSCRSLREPFTRQSFGSLVDEYFVGKDFAEPLFEVPTVNVERTFLEKLFLLHEEFQRPADKSRVNRLSRHIYDIHQLTHFGIASKALADKELYETIVAHRFKFTRLADVDYNLHHPHTLNPIPPDDIISLWQSDYQKMTEDMIYDEVKPTFSELIENLNWIVKQLRSVEWNYDLQGF